MSKVRIEFDLIQPGDLIQVFSGFISGNKLIPFDNNGQVCVAVNRFSPVPANLDYDVWRTLNVKTGRHLFFRKDMKWVYFLLSRSDD